MLLPEGSWDEPPIPRRRYVIAAGTAKYNNLEVDAQLPSVDEDLRQIVDLFTDNKLGYEHVLPELAKNPSSAELRSTLSNWFTSSDRKSTDLVVIYYSGHGVTDAGRHYLLAADSSMRNLVGSALPTEELARILTQTPVRQLLLLLDTCYSGTGIREFASVAAGLISPLKCGELSETSVWAVAAARPKEEAGEGAFARAIVRAVRYPEDRYDGVLQPFLFIDAVTASINQNFRLDKRQQHAWGNSPGFDSVPRFIPNPRYQPGIPVWADIETQRLLVRVDRTELLTHWSPRARGVEVESQPGWYFTGRTKVLRGLVKWLAEPQSDGKARIVTGSPGCGKSAVLARLVTLSNTGHRQKAPLQNVGVDTVPPEGVIDVAIHAKGKTLNEILQSFGSALGIDEIDRGLLLEVLAHRKEKFVIVIDALDEAQEPKEIAEELLAKIVSVPQVRLLVGTRREYLPALGPSAEVINLDHSENISLRDISEYVKLRLLAEHDPEVPTPYRKFSKLAQEVADAVAKRAFPIFLIARLVSHSLIEAESPVNVRQLGWQDSFPKSVDDAFEEYLRRFGSDRERVCDLLRPLAYAKGTGLPWVNLWAPLASALSGRTYTEADVEWVIDKAGAYILQGIEQERSVYRPYHQALADHLVIKTETQRIQKQFVRVLVGQVPELTPGGRKDWPAAHPYIRRHLATHASEAGMLADLVKEPLYILAADPNRLLLALSGQINQLPDHIIHIYQRTFHHLKSKSLPLAGSYFEMVARQSGATDFANQFADLPLRRPWSVPWAHWTQEATHRIIKGHESPVLVLAITRIGERVVIISGGQDGTIRRWDLADGSAIGEPLMGHTDSVNALAVGRFWVRPVIVSGSSDQTIRVWDLVDGVPIGQPFSGHSSAVTAVAVTSLNEHQVVVSGSRDGTIQVRDLADGKLIYKSLKSAPVTAAVAAEILSHGTVVVHTSFGFGVDVTKIPPAEPPETVSTFDRWNRLRSRTPYKAIRSSKEVQDLSKITFRLIKETQELSKLTYHKSLHIRDLVGHTDSVLALTLCKLKGRQLVISGGHDCTVRVWDLERGTAVGMPFRGHTDAVTSVTIGMLNGQPIVVSSSRDRTIRKWNLFDGSPMGEPLTGHSDSVNSVVVDEWERQPVIVSASSDQTLRVWNLAEASSEEIRFASFRNRIDSVAVGELGGQRVVASGSDDCTIRLWDLTKGTPLSMRLVGHTGRVRALALSTIDGQAIIVSASDDHDIRIWSISGLNPTSKKCIGHTAPVAALALGQQKGRPIVVSGSYDGTVRLWDLATAEPLGTPMLGHTDWVTGVAVCELKGQAVSISVSHDRTLRIWDLNDCKLVGTSSTGHTEWATAVAAGRLAGTQVVVSSSTDHTVRLYDLSRGTVIGIPLFGHTGSVTALLVGELDRIPMVISGSADQTVRVWELMDSGRKPREIIDVGSRINSLAFAGPSTVVAAADRGIMAIDLLPVIGKDVPVRLNHLSPFNSRQ